MNPVFIFCSAVYLLVHSATHLNIDQQSEHVVPEDEQGKYASQVQHTVLKWDEEVEDNAINEGDVAIEYNLRLWPGGLIPYTISSEYEYADRCMIDAAFQKFSQESCIRFVPRNPRMHSDYIFIQSGERCSSSVGRKVGRQNISLNKTNCMKHGTITHELMHAVGFHHEQSRHDRHKNVKIIWSNILPGDSRNFQKFISREIVQLGLPYDYNSIMHYSDKQGSINGAATIQRLKPFNMRMGQRSGLSILDVRKLNMLYRCPDFDDSVNPECGNFGWFCFLWGWMGYCRSDEQYMIRYCPHKCDFCAHFRLSHCQGRDCLVN